MSNITKIALVDDHSLFRKGLISLLKEFPQVEIGIEAGNGQELLQHLRVRSVQVVLLDISMPVMDGIETLTRIKEQHNEIKVIMLTQHADEQTIYHLMEKGAHGFLPKDANVELIVDAISSTVEKGFYFTEHVSRVMFKKATARKAEKPDDSSLSEREIEVIRLICRQMTIAQIGDELCLSPRTIDSYIKKIYRKTGVKRREGIVFYAIEHKLI